jgi:hypothetical protein
LAMTHRRLVDRRAPHPEAAEPNPMGVSFNGAYFRLGTRCESGVTPCDCQLATAKLALLTKDLRCVVSALSTPLANLTDGFRDTPGKAWLCVARPKQRHEGCSLYCSQRCTQQFS